MKPVFPPNTFRLTLWTAFLTGLLLPGWGAHLLAQEESAVGTQTGESAVFSSENQSFDPPVSSDLTPGAATSLVSAKSPSPPAVVDPEEFVRRAIWQAVWGPALTASVRQRTQIQNAQMVGVGGFYAHAGQGTGKTKWTMPFAVAGRQSSYLQISDGKLLWISEHTVDHTILTRIDMSRVREQLGPLSPADINNPLLAIDLAVGGQAQILRHLYHRYHWIEAKPDELDKRLPVWVLRGELRTQPPIPSGRAPVDTAMIGKPKTDLLPATVRLTLGREGQIPYFPYRIEYFQASKDGQPAARISVIEFYEVTCPAAMKPEWFQYEVLDTVEQIHDETSRFLPAAPLNLSQQPSSPVQR